MDNIKTQLESVAMVREVRGKGLMIGIELTQACSPLVALAKDRGLLINVTAEKVIRLLPALTMSDEESDNMVNLLSQLIKEYAAQ